MKDDKQFNLQPLIPKKVQVHDDVEQLQAAYELKKWVIKKGKWTNKDIEKEKKRLIKKKRLRYKKKVSFQKYVCNKVNTRHI